MDTLAQALKNVGLVESDQIPATYDHVNTSDLRSLVFTAFDGFGTLKFRVDGFDSEREEFATRWRQCWAWPYQPKVSADCRRFERFMSSD